MSVPHHPQYRPTPDGSAPPGVAASGAGEMDESARRVIGVVSWFSMVFAGFVGPLMVYITFFRKDRVLRDHGAKGVCFSVTWTLLAIVWIICAVFGSVWLQGEEYGLSLGPALILLSILIPIGMLYVVPVIGAVLAGTGRRWRYPLWIPFLR